MQSKTLRWGAACKNQHQVSPVPNTPVWDEQPPAQLDTNPVCSPAFRNPALPKEAIIKKLLLSLPLHSEAGVSVFHLASLETTHPPCHRSHTPCSDLLNSQHHLNTPPRTVSSKTQVLRIMSNMQFEDSDWDQQQGPKLAGKICDDASSGHIVLSSSLHLITLFHLLKCSGGEISVLWNQEQCLAKRDGFHGPLRPTTEKSIILFYSCGAISFFLNPYYSYTIKLSWKQPDSFGGWDAALRLPACNAATLHWGTRAHFLHLLTLHLTHCPCDSLLPAWLVVIFQLNVLKIKLFKQQWPATMLFGILP